MKLGVRGNLTVNYFTTSCQMTINLSGCFRKITKEGSIYDTSSF